MPVLAVRGAEPNPLTPFPVKDTLTPGADAVPSPAKKRERVILYSGEIEGEPRKYGAMTGIGCGDLEPVPASLARSCPAGVTPAPSGLISPPLSARNALPRSERSLATVRSRGDPALRCLISPPLSARNADWMRRFGTGTGFAGAKLSEVVARSERSLATVRMTDFAELSEVLPRSERSLATVRMTEKSVSPRVRAT